jgi:hypothetical protein
MFDIKTNIHDTKYASLSALGYMISLLVVLATALVSATFIFQIFAHFLPYGAVCYGSVR